MPQWRTRQQVQVQVEYGLPGMLPAVDDQAVTFFGQTLRARVRSGR